ncbi:hypothetical protein ACFQZZ_06340 [Nocardia sp. GCM10030253]|uniref:primosomal protein N' family DNA-binding protein n=1 Tax=Nocardia sp. GCM10030253 TaxID=3273404 RepID=UPI00362C4050
MLPLLSPAHLDRDFDYLVPPELDAIAQPGVRVRVRFAGRLVDGYLLARLPRSDHSGKLVKLERVVSPERVLTPEILRLATTVAARYAGTRADVLRLAIPPRHARTETGGSKKSADPVAAQADSPAPAGAQSENSATPGHADDAGRIGGAATSEAPAPNVAAPTTIATSVAAESGSDEDAGAISGSTTAAAPTPDDAPAVVDSTPAATDSARVQTNSPTGAAGSDAAPLSAETSAPQPYSPMVGSSPGESSVTFRTDSSASVPDSRSASTATATSAQVAEVDGAAEAESADLPRRRARGVVSADPAAVVDPDIRRAQGADPGDSDGGNVAGTAGVAASTAALPVDPALWERYIHGTAFLTALGQGRGPRAVWQALPGEEWARRLAELAAVVVAGGRSAILIVPDQRDLDRVLAECVRLVGDSAVGLAAGLGPAARYRRWLAALRGNARVVVGTRSAVFAPTTDLGLIAIWDDGDDTYAEPRAPYPHAREVAMLRAHETGAAFIAAGFARTAETQSVVDSGWAHDLIPDRGLVRKFSPRISAPGDTDMAMERDPVARAVRIPGVAFAAARQALKEGAAVLVQVPRRGYIPSLACAKCRTPARCRHCNGPLALPEVRSPRDDVAHSPSCRWCGIVEAAFRCASCGSRALRAVVIGAARTAEELGRAFPGVPIRGSGGGAMLDTVEPGPQVVVATVGAEPVLPGGYGVALLLDGWALLSRADLRAAEDTLRRWMSAATLVRAHGQVVVMAEPSIPTVQALLRWDPVGHAHAEMAGRTEVGFPPAVRMAAIDGSADAVAELLAATNLPDGVDVLGPVPLPPGARKPFGGDSPAEVERMLLRVDRISGAALSRALTAAQAVRSTHRSDAPLRVQIDPVDIG